MSAPSPQPPSPFQWPEASLKALIVLGCLITLVWGLGLFTALLVGLLHVLDLV